MEQGGPWAALCRCKCVEPDRTGPRRARAPHAMAWWRGVTMPPPPAAALPRRRHKNKEGRIGRERDDASPHLPHPHIAGQAWQPHIPSPRLPPLVHASSSCLLIWGWGGERITACPHCLEKMHSLLHLSASHTVHVLRLSSPLHHLIISMSSMSSVSITQTHHGLSSFCLVNLLVSSLFQ